MEGMPLKEKITPEELALLPPLVFGGQIEVVECSRKQKEAALYLSRFDVVGFDTESRPSFRKGVQNRVSLLQLSAGGRAFLIRINGVGLSRHILRILQSDRIMKVGLALNNDLHELRGAAAFTPRNFVDLQELVGHYGITDMSLQKIAGIVLHGRMSKAQRLSNWDAKVLTQAQMLYAATDAWVCEEIYRCLNEKYEKVK